MGFVHTSSRNIAFEQIAESFLLFLYVFLYFLCLSLATPISIDKLYRYDVQICYYVSMHM